MRQLPKLQVPVSLRACYAKPGTDLAYGAMCLARAMRSPVLAWCMVLSGYARAMRGPELT
eukprot:1473467-Rhodomonas_salina.1